MKTRVINLQRSFDRRRIIGSRLDELGMKFEFVDGVDGQRLTSDQLSSYSSRAAFSCLGREMHRNEVGCISSHMAVWRELLASDDEYMLVMEDDMLIADDFPSLVRNIEWIPGDAAVVNFSWDMANPIDVHPINSVRSLCRFDKDVMRAGAYILHRKGAQRLLERAFPIRMPVDSLMGDPDNVGPIYGVTPRPVQWNVALPTETWTDATMDSFTQSSRKSLRGIILRAANKLFR